MTVTTQINGVTVTRDLPPHASLFDLVNDGRETPCDDARCLRCLLLVGDRIVHACRTPAFRARDNPITTSDAIDSRPEYHDIVRAFRRVGLEVCVDTHPYLVMLALHQLLENDNPNDDELNLLSKHLNDRCSNRADFERAVRILTGTQRRRKHERPQQR